MKLRSRRAWYFTFDSFISLIWHCSFLSTRLQSLCSIAPTLSASDRVLPCPIRRLPVAGAFDIDGSQRRYSRNRHFSRPPPSKQHLREAIQDVGSFVLDSAHILGGGMESYACHNVGVLVRYGADSLQHNESRTAYSVYLW